MQEPQILDFSNLIFEEFYKLISKQTFTQNNSSKQILNLNSLEMMENFTYPKIIFSLK